LPEVDQVNYITRVTAADADAERRDGLLLPVETAQKPMFDMLGTPPEHKRRVTYRGGHSVPRVEMIKETLAWLDRYQGPVKES
jgi:hypothetical protein